MGLIAAPVVGSLAGGPTPPARRSHAVPRGQRPPGVTPGSTTATPAIARFGRCVISRIVANLYAMNDDPQPPQYDIRVRGVLSERLLTAFPEMQARARARETVLTGALPDQSALHGVLGRIEALGLELLEVRRRPGRRAG
jgi:hypothetical protein